MKNKNSKESVSFLLISSFKIAPWYLIIAAICMVINGLIPATQLKVTQILIDKIYDVFSVGYTNEWLKIFLPILMFQLSLFVLKTLTVSFRQNLIELAGRKIRLINQEKLIKVASKCPVDLFESSEFYNNYSNALNNITSIESTYSWILNLIEDSVTLISVGYVLFDINPYFLVAIVFVSILQYIVRNKFEISNWGYVISETPEQRRLSYLDSVLSSKTFAKEIRIFGAFPFFIKKREREVKKLFKNNEKRFYKTEIVQIFMSLINTAVLIVFYVVAIKQTSNGVSTVGEIVIIFSAISSFQDSMNGFILELIYTQRCLRNAKLVANFLELYKNKTIENCSNTEINTVLNEKGIRFENVSFTYPGSDNTVLENVSFFIPEGQHTAIVGKNGCGKTTIIKLMMGMYTPSSGTVYIDGFPVSLLTKEVIREKFTAIFQDFICYNISLAENIAFEDKDDKNGIETAIEKAGLSSVVEHLPNGIETILGAQFGGTDLSIGQWQRVALARAFYKNTSCIVMDEPTASLDPRAEYELIKSYSKIMKGKTSIVVSHRFSNVKDLDHIMVVSDKNISEQGTHNELMNLNGIYYELYSTQASMFVETEN